MKYIDMVLVVLIIFICAAIPLDYHIKRLERQQLVDIDYNLVMDAAVYDSVENNYVIDGDRAYVDPEGAWETLKTGTSQTLSLNPGGFLVVAVLAERGFWLLEDEEFIWNAYVDTADVSLAEQFSLQVSEALNGYQVTFPSIDREEWYNTVPQNGMFVVYDGGLGDAVHGIGAGDLVVSGAAVRVRGDD